MSDLTNKAYHFAVLAHSGQTRRDGEPYIFHPLAVALQVAKVTKDDDMISAALLHDVIEDTLMTGGDIKEEFNDHIASLVQELTTDEEQKELLGKKVCLSRAFLTMSDEALLIKLADRFHNMRSLIVLDDIDFIEWYYNETIYILDKLNKRSLNDDHMSVLYKLVRTLRALNTMFDLEK